MKKQVQNFFNVLFVAAGLLSAPIMRSQTVAVVSPSQAIPNANTAAISSTGAHGQSFLASMTGTMTNVNFTVSAVPAPGTFSLQIFNGATVAGAPLLTQVITVSAAGPQSIVLSTPLILNFNAPYTFYITGIGTANMQLQANNANPYAAGTMWYQGGQIGGWDLVFGIRMLGVPGAAMSFDGNNDYMSAPVVCPTTNFTNEFWFKTTVGTQGIFSARDANLGGNFDREIALQGGNIRAYMWQGGPQEFISTTGTNFADGQWHHVAHVVGAAVGGQRIYVDGVLRAQGTFAFSSFNWNTVINLGYASTNAPNFFNGQIDELRCWNVVRSQCDINTYKNCEIPTGAAGLMANYHFNNGVAAGPNAGLTAVQDFSGFNRTGTLINLALNGPTSNWVAPGPFTSGFTTPLAAPAVSVTANPALSVCSGNTVSLSGAGANTYAWTGGITNGTAFTPAAGITGYTVTGTNTLTTCSNTAAASLTVSACSGTVASALNFNNASVPDNVLLPTAIATSSLIGGNKISVEAWVRPTSLANLGCVVGNYATPNPNMQFLLRRDNNFYTFWVGNSATNSWTGVFSTAGTATLNTWHHVAGVYNGTVLSIYINGVLSSTATANYTFAPTTNSLLIGGNNISENFNGDIDEVRIWNTARTQCDINTYKNCEIPTNATGLVANYHFNQGFAAAANPTVTTLTDATSNAFNGTLNTFALNGATSNWVAPSGVANGFTTALAAPSISVAANPALGVCSGSSLSLTGSGVNTYTWTGGITNGTAFTPTASANYTVNGTNSITTCTATAVSNVTVNAIPTVSVNSGAICSGNSFTMAPTGAATYSYSSGSAVVTPTATAAYTVTGSSAQGCNASAISNVTVNPLPSVNATSSSSLICVGQSATLTATGATTYSWSTGGATATEVITPTVTTSYTVTGVDANSCVNSAVVTQSVSACTGVNELGNAFNAVRLYPNPTSSDITLELPENANVVIYNSLGQVIFNQNLTYGNNVINLDALAKGIYVVQISNAANKANYRVVKH